jgi:hypothetical protein
MESAGGRRGLSLAVERETLERMVNRMMEDRKTCETCIHLKVCLAYKTVASFVASTWKEGEPFKPENIAAICRYYHRFVHL